MNATLVDSHSTREAPLVSPDADLLLKVDGLSKSFPGVKALEDVSFDLKTGEVHCLIGENGAGKSTLVKTLAGVQSADTGTIAIDGQIVHFDGPTDAIDAGIACIFQELSVVPGLTVAENIHLGDEPGRWGLFATKEAETSAQRLLDEIGFSTLKVSRLCGDLSPAQKQAVMIAKALRQNARIIIMDEPTSPLEESEVRQLFEIIEKLKNAGKGIIYVSHKMREIDELGDRVTVFKDGRLVATVPRGEATADDLVRMMVGRTLSALFPERIAAPGDVVLECKGLTGGVICDVTLEVRQGEILGIAGLVGSGRTELLQSLFGADHVSSGEVLVDGKTIKANSIFSAIDAGIAMVPEERRASGIISILAVEENMSIVWDQYQNQRSNDLSRSDALQEMVDLLAIKTPSLAQPISALSGGNQQKVVLSKWLLMSTRILLLDEPTRGVDVGAKREIYEIINDLATKGLAVILVSSELPELLGLTDRMLVMNGGCVVGELPGSASEEDVIAMSLLHAT